VIILKNLNTFFEPKSVCLIGASDKSGSVGNTIAKNLSNFKGKVYFTNPRLSGKKLFGKKVFSSITGLSEKIDLSIVATPAAITYEVVKEIAKAKCKNILMVTSGFSEIGRTDLTEKIKTLILKEKINLIGPNCLGILNLSNNLDATFNSRENYDLPMCGKVSIITQSGALGIALLDVSSKQRLEINKFVSYGNALDVDETDLLEYFEKDTKTDIILCYIEGVKNGNKFYKTLKKVTKKKKVIVLKGGISEKGTTAVKSHTAAIAGSTKVFSTALRQAGAIEVKTIKEMFDLSRFFSWYKVDSIKDSQIITNGGGFGVLTTDLLEINKLKLSEVTKETAEKIKKIMPGYATIGNPIDLTGDAGDDRFVQVIDLCLKDKNTNSIIVLMLLQMPSISSTIPEKIAKLKANTKKPIMVVTIGGNKTEEKIKEFEKRKVLCFRDPSEITSVLKYLK
jgi:acyl-CoA synthetase (NDP forming)